MSPAAVAVRCDDCEREFITLEGNRVVICPFCESRRFHVVAVAALKVERYGVTDGDHP